MDGFAQVTDGFERWDAHRVVPRHIHRDAYAAVILSGSYEECGSRGRFRVGAGDVLAHDGFDAHLNRFQSHGAKILNLAIANLVAPFGSVTDPDTIARTAERDPIAATHQLREQFRPRQCSPEDWPDLLARDLLRNPERRLEDWAKQHGLTAETISRGFRKVFGLTPARFRLEARARRAFALIMGGDTPLARVAAAAGFADQAHLSRSVRGLTGMPPCSWRRSNSFKTAAAKVH